MVTLPRRGRLSGPLARTVEDAAAMLDAMAVPCPAEPIPAPPLPAQSFLAHARRAPGRLRIGRYADPGLPGVEPAEECRQAWEEASVLLDELGHEVVDTTAAFDPDAVVPAFEMIWAVGAHSIPVPAGRHDMLQPFTRWLRERGSEVSGPQFLDAMTRIQVAGRAAVAAHADRAAGHLAAAALDLRGVSGRGSAGRQAGRRAHPARAGGAAAARPFVDPSATADLVERRTDRYRDPVASMEIILLLVGLPLGIMVLLGLITLWPNFRRRPRYRPGHEWNHPPLWWTANPEALQPAAPGHQHSQSRAARGGCRGDW